MKLIFLATPDNRYAWTRQEEVHQVDADRLKCVNMMGCLILTGQFIMRCLHESETSSWFYAYLTAVAKQIKQT